MPVNRQLKNVGNRGDLHKHLALIALAEILRPYPGACHIETHSFLLHAPLPDPAAFEAALQALPQGPVLARYLALQAPYLALGAYRCSGGLARDVLGPGTRLYLSEAHAQTRAQLLSQIHAEGAIAEVLEDAAQLADLSLEPAPMLLHVDPFEHPRSIWPVVEALVKQGGPVLVLCFAWDKTGPILWPPAPAGLVLLGERPDPPYGLAAWASPELQGAAQGALGMLGWAYP